MNTSYASLLRLHVCIIIIELVKNAENIQGMTTPVNNYLHAYSFESKPPPNRQPNIYTSVTGD